MVNKHSIGDTVAAEMQKIITSEKHLRLFKKKANKNCCNCNKKCSADCACQGKCKEDCNECSYATEKQASAISEIVDMFSNISEVQDYLGLEKSSKVTLKALAVMMAEIKKCAGIEDDSNDIRWDELIQPIKSDSDLRRQFRNTELEDPDILELLKKRINESHEGLESNPSNLFNFVDADPYTFESEPDAVILPDEAPTLAPDDSISDSLTDLPPRSLRLFDRIPSHPISDNLADLVEQDDNYDRPTAAPSKYKEEDDDDDDDMPTLKPMKHQEASSKSSLTKQADDTFEDESDEELDQLFSELEPLSPNTDDSLSADDDLFESEDIFEDLPEDRETGFTYDPDLGGPYGFDKVRREKDDWVNFKDLPADERLEHEMNAGLHDQLDIDPDELSGEDLPDFAEYYDEQEDFGDDPFLD